MVDVCDRLRNHLATVLAETAKPMPDKEPFAAKGMFHRQAIRLAVAVRTEGFRWWPGCGIISIQVKPDTLCK
jgi:hypothetical protein